MYLKQLEMNGFKSFVDPTAPVFPARHYGCGRAERNR